MNKEHAEQEAIEFLHKNNTMVIATVSEAGDPQASTVYFASDDALNLYFATYIGSQKHKNLKANGKIAVVIGSGPQVQTIQAGGIATEFPMDEQRDVLEKIMTASMRTPDEWPFLAFSKKGYAIFKMRPTWMVWLNFHKEDFKENIEEDFIKII